MPELTRSTQDFSPIFALLGYGDIKPDIVNAFMVEIPSDPKRGWNYRLQDGDGAVDRQRSVVATRLMTSHQDMVLMCDHDITWNFGDARYMVEMCHKTRGIVGALVSKRAARQGFGSRWYDGKPHEICSGELLELGEDEYVGGAFTCYHRDVFEAIAKTMEKLPSNESFWPFFMPIQKMNKKTNSVEYLSEDWVVCHRAREAGCKVHLAFLPQILHHGQVTFSVVDGNV